MRTALSVALAVSFFAFVIAHVGLVAQIARAKRLVRAALALVVPPLAPFWGFELGFRRIAQAWLAALIAYVVALTALSI
ncbi:MAG TPA: hypothetical protein VF407_06490 [Polyangiaceae bacterium]